jgi:hypothetical protein
VVREHPVAREAWELGDLFASPWASSENLAGGGSVSTPALPCGDVRIAGHHPVTAKRDAAIGAKSVTMSNPAAASLAAIGSVSIDEQGFK